MRDPVWMADLLRRVPVLAIDVAAAAKAGDVAALSYRRAVDEWRAEVALALAEADLLDCALPAMGGHRHVEMNRGGGPVGESSGHLIDQLRSAPPANDCGRA